MIFSTMQTWNKLNVSKEVVIEKYAHFFGVSDRIINDRKQAEEFLKNQLLMVQNKLLAWIRKTNTDNAISDLLIILDEIYHFYLSERHTRTQLKKYNYQDDFFYNSLVTNKNIANDIINAINIWIENTILLQNNTLIHTSNALRLNKDLLIDLYIYGLLSTSVSLISLCK